MESMEITNLFRHNFLNQKVLITGHTGFKGAWLTKWLDMLGAVTYGISLPEPISLPNHFENLEFKNLTNYFIDIRNKEELENIIVSVKPDFIFHLAAQSLVRESYVDPLATYETNIIGTLNVFEVVRKNLDQCILINVTSDKAYENKEIDYAYKETDQMGGFDPYSSSKGCAELITSCYERSFFSNGIKLASVRAGNVIGGGDWAKDRLIPDLFKAAEEEKITEIRNPKAIRPWQHVLDPISGYLTLAQAISTNGNKFVGGWNFGPLGKPQNVIAVIQKVSSLFPSIKYKISENTNHPHEANLLMLDCSKACEKLKWIPVWGFDDTVEKTTEWYKNFYTQSENINSFSENQINKYCETAINKNITWTK